MDALAGLLDGPRARGAFLMRSVLEPPFGLRIQDEAPLTLICVVRGHAWVLPDRGERVRLGPGDVAVVRGPEPYTVADEPATKPSTVILPGNHSATLTGDDLCGPWDLGTRTWGDNPDGSTMLLTGAYQLPGEISRRLLDALPALLVAHRGQLELPADSAAQRRDRQGRAGSGRGPGPVAGPAADRGAAYVVRPCRGAGLVSRAWRPGGRARVAYAPSRPGRALDGRAARRLRRCLRARRSPAASPTWSVSPRWRI